MRVKFTEDTIYETEGRNKGHRFKAGEVHDFSDEFAQRWIRRGLAVNVDSQPQFKPLTRIAGKAAEEPGAEELPDFEAMTKAELETFAVDNGIEVDISKTKAEMIETIEAGL